MSDKTSLGDRMKGYENVTRYFLPKRSHVIIRLDGKAFHSYTRGLDKPYDLRLRDAMAVAAYNVMSNLQGSSFAYIQSDEVSILLSDFKTIDTDAAYGNNLSKLISISASIMTAHFNKEMKNVDVKKDCLAYFDSRAFCIPDPIEVYNYFVWRQRDCIRNSIQSLGQSYFSQSELHGLNGNEIQHKLLTERDINWAHQLPQFKNGTIILPNAEVVLVEDAFTRTDQLQSLMPVRQD